MAGLKGKSGPPGNMNAFKHGLAAIQKRREEGVPTEHEETVRQQILERLDSRQGGDLADISRPEFWLGTQDLSSSRSMIHLSIHRIALTGLVDSRAQSVTAV